jgi:hypothetical protein
VCERQDKIAENEFAHRSPCRRLRDQTESGSVVRGRLVVRPDPSLQHFEVGRALARLRTHAREDFWPWFAIGHLAVRWFSTEV